MDFLTLGIVAIALYMWSKKQDEAAPSSNAGSVTNNQTVIRNEGVLNIPQDTSKGSIGSDIPPISTLPSYTGAQTYNISQQDVNKALSSQDGSIQTGWAAQTAVVQQSAMVALQQMREQGITQQQFDFIKGIMDQRNPATGSYWKYDEIMAATGLTETQVGLVTGYFQSVHLANMSAPAVII